MCVQCHILAFAGDPEAGHKQRFSSWVSSGLIKEEQTLSTPKCDPEFRVYICRGGGVWGAGAHSRGREKLPAGAGREASLACYITCSSHVLFIPHLLPKGCHTASRGKHGYERPEQL